MEGVDKSTELWRHPKLQVLVFDDNSAKTSTIRFYNIGKANAI